MFFFENIYNYLRINVIFWEYVPLFQDNVIFNNIFHYFMINIVLGEYIPLFEKNYKFWWICVLLSATLFSCQRKKEKFNGSYLYSCDQIGRWWQHFLSRRVSGDDSTSCHGEWAALTALPVTASERRWQHFLSRRVSSRGWSTERN